MTFNDFYLLPFSVLGTVLVLSSVDDLTLFGDKYGTRKFPRNCFRSKVDIRNQIARITIRLATFLEFCCCLAILDGNSGVGLCVGVAKQKDTKSRKRSMSLMVLLYRFL